MTTSASLAYTAHKVIENPDAQAAVLCTANTVNGPAMPVVALLLPPALRSEEAAWSRKMMFE